MTGHPSEADLALYAGGDLMDSIAQHLDNCPSCRANCESIRASLTVFTASAAALAPSDAELARLRERVLEPGSRLKWWHWVLAPAMCVLALLFWWPEPVHWYYPPEQPSRLEASVAPVPHELRLPRRHVTHAQTGLRSAQLIAGTMRFTTADPNVVILIQTPERTMPND